jgi:hypothetical protein
MDVESGRGRVDALVEVLEACGRSEEDQQDQQDQNGVLEVEWYVFFFSTTRFSFFLGLLRFCRIPYSVLANSRFVHPRHRHRPRPTHRTHAG